MSTTVPVSPANLGEVVTSDQEGYQLKVAYSLALAHGRMGYFPAIVTEGDRVIMVLEKGLLEAVWKMLPPRRSYVDKGLVYANGEGALAFPVGGGEGLAELLSGTPMPVLTRSKFEQLTASGENPFKWALGLVGKDMSPGEFADTVQAALEKCEA